MDYTDDLAALTQEIAESEHIDRDLAHALAVEIYDAVQDYADRWNDMAARTWSRQHCEALALAA